MKNEIDHKVKEGIYRFEKVTCAICNGNEFESLSNKDRYGLYMPVVICKECGLIQTNPRMTQAAYNAFYNVEYRKLYGGNEKPTEAFLIKQYGQGRKIFDYVYPFLYKSKPPEQWYVVEVGCGAGGILKYFHDQGCRIAGVDLGDEYIQYGICKYGLDLLTGTLRDLPVDIPPDLIIYSHVIEHILNPAEELEMAHSRLADHGLLYIELPGVRNLSGSYRLDFLRMLQNAHVYHFTLDTLVKLLNKSRFRLVTGDEKIRSLFSKTERPMTPSETGNDYPEIVHYLRRMELFHYLGSISPSALLLKTRITLILILQKLGLYYYTKKLIWRITKRSG